MAMWSVSERIFSSSKKLRSVCSDIVPSPHNHIMHPITTTTTTTTTNNSNNNSLHLYYHNNSGIRTKSQAIYSSLLCFNYDIVIFTETWLNSDFKSEEYFPSCYTVFRRDRDPNLGVVKGGGVIVAVNNDLEFDQINLNCGSGESIIVKVRCGSFWLFIVAVYIPFGSTADVYHGFMEFIAKDVLPQYNENGQLLIVGDFNLPKISWYWIDAELMGSSVDITSNYVLDSFANLGTRQFNTVFNEFGRILDLVFSSLEFIEIESCPDLAGHTSIYHTPLLIKFDFMDSDFCNFVENDFKFDFRNADVPSLNNFFDNVDWTALLNLLDISDAVSKFYSIMMSAFELFVPKILMGSTYAEPWFNRRLKNLANRKSRAFKNYKRSGCLKDNARYRDLCREFKYLNDFLYKMYILRIETEVSFNPKRFFAFINQKRKSRGYPRIMSCNNVSFSGPQEICDAFANFFQSSFDNSDRSNPSNIIDYRKCSYPTIQFDVSEIINGLENLDITLGAGPDGISPWILNKCALALSNPLLYLFNESLSSGMFPDFWKKSFIVPIFKSGRKSDIMCYRGISILSAIPKLFESLVKSRIEPHIKKRISSRQHGFIQGKSSVTNLMVFSSDVFETVGNRGQVDVIYTDFARAFDKLNHKILLQKLMDFGIDLFPIKWIASYLTARQQCVSISQVRSFEFDIPSGVPQGSHLGPLLFTVFINDVVQCFKYSKCLMYADDLKIYATISSVIDTEHMQDDLDVFSEWSARNKLPLNTSKCKVMSFCRSRLSSVEVPYLLMDEQISRVSDYRDLGVIFSINLTFHKHVDYIITKGYSMLGFIKRNAREFCDPLTFKSLYVTYVRSVLEYASVIWNPFYQTHSDRIESIQKQFLIYALRRLPNLNHGFVREPYINRLALLNLQTLESRRNIASATFARDILCSTIDCPELLEKFCVNAPQRALRSRPGLLRIPFCINNFNNSAPLLYVFKVFNDNYEHFDFNISRELFKKRMRQK